MAKVLGATVQGADHDKHWQRLGRQGIGPTEHEADGSKGGICEDVVPKHPAILSVRRAEMDIDRPFNARQGRKRVPLGQPSDGSAQGEPENQNSGKEHPGHGRTAAGHCSAAGMVPAIQEIIYVFQIVR
jgi:hypothetical protein